MWASRIVVEELYRITKPGGVLLLSTPNRYSLESLKGLARYLANGTVWNARDDTHVTIFSLGALRRLLQHRFKIEKQLGYFFLPGVGHRATPLSYVITANPALIWLYHKLFLVARRRN
jgi:SAM-dependent methyltransferase